MRYSMRAAPIVVACVFVAFISQPIAIAQTVQPSSTSETTTICGQALPSPATLPPPDSAPVVLAIAPCFIAQGGVSAIEPQTYLHYIHLRPSLPSQRLWVPYDEQARATMLDDFKRLWATGFLDDLSIEVTDHALANGVLAKLVTYHLEERRRLRVIEYTGSTNLASSDIDKALTEAKRPLRSDTFLDDRDVTHAAGVIRRLLAEKGYLDARVTTSITAVPGSPRLVNVTLGIDDGPRYQIRRIEFVGNQAIGDRTLRKRMKQTRARSLLSFVTGSGTYKQDSIPEDLERLMAFYRDHGYLRARIDNPEVRVVGNGDDGRRRYVELHVPVAEGARYRIGSVSIADNTVITSDALQTLFLLKPSDYYVEKRLREGLEKARELYGSLGYFEFTAFPDFTFRDPSAPEAAGSPATPAIVDITLRMQEGEQYFVHRLAFTGNVRTRDSVIRREMHVREGGVFSTQALKYSVRRLNQLGYFKPIEESGTEDVVVEKTPGQKNKLDVTLKLNEQNRNEVSFGGGMSGIDGLYVHGSYGTSNFLGMGETLQVSMQHGARSNLYQVSVTEPYLFGRPISTGVTLFTRKVDYYIAADTVGYSEVRTGASVSTGWLLGRFLRLFGGYGYEVIDTAVRDDLLASSTTSNPGDPVFDQSLDQGRHIESRVTPSLVYDSVDQPLFPRRGMRLSGSYEVSGGLLGGTVDYVRPEAEAVVYLPLRWMKRTAFGLRGQAGWITPYANTRELPYYRRFFLGGETQIRGVDIRTVGPLDAQRRALGGNKFVLFNLEYYVDIMRSVRALAFHDAGQAFAEGEPVDLRQLRTSSGVELRVLMPVMNVPFRFIYAWNLYRDTFQPARTFKFAVGSTF